MTGTTSKLAISASALAMSVAGAQAAFAQSPAQPAKSAQSAAPAAGAQPAEARDPATDGDEIVVTGYRASLEKSLDLKRRADVMLDAISSDDIASFPEANVAESLQRIPGVSIDRDNGEGRQISVRGLGGDFTRVRINGMEALSTNASLMSALSTPNQSRSFDFNTFASELFSQAAVRKTTSAETDEGSLGATVDLNTPHPFDYKGQRIAFNAADAYYTNGGKNAPRLSGLYSNRFFGNAVGLLLSGAFQQRSTIVSNYKRAPGQGDLVYRGQNWSGNEYPPRAGFAAPAGTVFNQSILTGTGRCPGVTGGSTYPAGTVCTYSPTVTTPIVTPGFYTSAAVTRPITNPLVLSAETGSDPAAYAALYPAGYSNAPARYDDSTVIIPSLPGLAQQRLNTQRIGLTGSLQFKISNSTRLTIDGLYSKFDQTSDQYGIEPVGLGRNNTNTTLNTLPTGASVATRRGLYPNSCTYAAGNATAAAQDCGQALYGTTPVTSYTYSFNPYNLDTFEYYNNPSSPGYAPNAYGINGLIPLLGRPTTKVVGAEVNNGVADYLALSNVDWRTHAIRVTANTQFKQASAVLDQAFSDSFKTQLAGGWSNSNLFYQSQQVEMNAVDRPETYVYDARGGGNMPIFDPGFDVSDASNWGIVKGLSVMRNNITTTDTTFYTGRADSLGLSTINSVCCSAAATSSSITSRRGWRATSTRSTRRRRRQALRRRR